jgi:allantoicase
MDGWETRRRRGAGAEEPHPTDDDHDWAVVRLGVPGVIRGVIVDTAHFTGNYPESGSVEAASVPGNPSPEEVEAAEWTEIVPRTPLKGDTAHEFAVDAEQRFTHVRLNIWPDGGVARLRVHGEVVADPRDLDGLTFDLAAQEFGGVATGASDRYFSSPHNLNSLGRAAVMGEGWETRRRRNKDNDWVELDLVGEGEVLAVEIDTTHFVANCPGWAAVSGRSAATGEWIELLPRTRLQPDTRHRVRVTPGEAVTAARLDVYPDGGIARLRLTGRLTEAGRAAHALRWLNLLPTTEAEQAFAEAGLTVGEARTLAAARPLADAAAVRSAEAALQPADAPDGAEASRRRAAIWRLLGV